jgi:DNA-binding MarR family transcriptional regulator
MDGLGLQRAWLDDEEGSIRFPDTRSGAQTRVIGNAASVADALLMSPSAVSQQIAQLEAEAGIELVERRVPGA